MTDDTHTHDHCPYDHEHPQPFEMEGKQYCGACWFRDKVLTEMVACVPGENCA